MAPSILYCLKIALVGLSVFAVANPLPEGYEPPCDPKTVTKHETVYKTKTVDGPKTTITVPGPEKTVTKEITKKVTETVAGPTVTKTVTDTVTKFKPGPTETKTVTDTVTKFKDGPTETKTVTKTVPTTVTVTEKKKCDDKYKTVTVKGDCHY